MYSDATFSLVLLFLSRLNISTVKGPNVSFDIMLIHNSSSFTYDIEELKLKRKGI